MIQVEIDAGMSLSAQVVGPCDGRAVLLLHGFPQTSWTWRAVQPALAAAGCLSMAPNQRGYSRRARPEAVEDYAVSLLLADALAVADACGAERFDLVGHDWGGQLAWLLAAGHPARVRTLTVLSRPHPAAFARAFERDPAQAERSKHHRAFQDPTMADRLLADDGAVLRDLLCGQGVAPADALEYLRPLRERAGMEGALNWYRAAMRGKGLAREDVPNVEVPVLYVWGDGDSSVGRIAAELTAEHVTGPYRFEELPGVGHFVTDEAAGRVDELLLSHLSDTPAD